MINRRKWIITLTLLLMGGVLIAWNLRDPDAALMEPKKFEEDVALDQVPEPVRVAIKQELAAGGRMDSLEKEVRGDKVNYEIDIVYGSTETEVEIGLDGAILDRETKKRK